MEKKRGARVSKVWSSICRPIHPIFIGRKRCREHENRGAPCATAAVLFTRFIRQPGTRWKRSSHKLHEPATNAPERSCDAMRTKIGTEKRPSDRWHGTRRNYAERWFGRRIIFLIIRENFKIIEKDWRFDSTLVSFEQMNFFLSSIFRNNGKCGISYWELIILTELLSIDLYIGLATK